MLGRELSRRYFYECIQPVIHQMYPDIEQEYSAGLIGWGSDVLGNDDELSQDHEWGPRCLLFYKSSLQMRIDLLKKELEKQLPRQFLGVPTRFVEDEEGIALPSQDGTGRVHIQYWTYDDYLTTNIGCLTPQDDLEWLMIPENKLLELTNGEIFHDGNEHMSAIRTQYAYFPENVWRYKLAFGWESLGWDLDLIGMCATRKDWLSFRYCVAMTAYRIIRLIFLLNKSYCPTYPKWFHREFYKLPALAPDLGEEIEACFRGEDAAEILQRFTHIMQIMLQFQVQRANLSPVEIRAWRYGRGYHLIDCHHIAQQIHQQIKEV